MSNRAVITTPSAPQAIGPYSQGIKVGNTVWISGQIPLDPKTMLLISGDITAESEAGVRQPCRSGRSCGGHSR